MHTLVAKPARRARRRYSEEFKRQVIDACLQQGVSVAAAALANGFLISPQPQPAHVAIQ